VAGRFGDLEIHCCGPWSQGPALAQGIGILASMPLARMGHNSARYLHVVVEALKLAFADRERWLGDPRHIHVPLNGLLADAYLRGRAELIRPDRAWPSMPPAGVPEDADESFGAPAMGDPSVASIATVPAGDAVHRGTSYVAVVDRAGNAFSATPSDVSWDSPIIPGLGICASPRGSQSSADPGHPSSLAPGKRPRVTPNPAIVMRAGRPHIVFGTPGGDMQPQAMLQYLLNSAVFGMDPQSAVDAPRIGTYSFPLGFSPTVDAPGLVMAEPGIAPATRAALRRYGHRVEPWPERSWAAGGVCAIHVDQERGLLEASADPRRASLALAV
jgi:gamma-glutamyltranspeptidase/glutathione hydrolase